MNTQKPVTQDDIFRAVWTACDIFRGVMDPANYKDYILTMLFLKYISDVWEKSKEDLKRKHTGDKGRIRRALRLERFPLPEGASFYDLYESRNESNIGERINQALDAIEDENKAKLEGVFRNIDFNSEANLGETQDRNRRLKELLANFNKPVLNLRHVKEDIIGNSYIYLIDRFASDAGKKAGEFYTPHMVSQLVARLCNPEPGTGGARICDPACGSGSLLIEAAKVIKKTRSKNHSLYGMEANGGTWALCRMNMFLHKFDSARIEWCNSLTAPQLLEKDKLMRFDYVVANPPFSLDKWGADDVADDSHGRFHRGVPPKSKGDYAFISHMVEVAKPRKGRVAVVVPHGVLFRGGAEGRIRQKLIEENLLDAVVGLPPNLFLTTGIPVAILVFDRSREAGGPNHERRDVLFIDASQKFQPGKNQNTLTEEHFDEIITVYKARKNKKSYAHVANLKEITENDFNLNIPRYVDTFEEEEPVNMDEVQKEIQGIEKELRKTQDRMKELLKEARL